ncbi:MAG: hypothetical protein PHH21_00040 [Candidatus Pacebacteria bacterium]|nr:hypothetical protein [Candidatus Paceibacterota bacterium]
MNKDLKQHVIALRRKGKTYAEICSLLKVDIPKGTLSCWCNNVPTPKAYIEKVRKLNALHLIAAREKSVEAAHKVRQKQIEEIRIRNNHLLETIKDVDVAKIALAMLYLGEGTKNRKRGSVGFGNSDPKTISLFMEFMRNIYDIDESKFRCTLLCRADQNIKKLEKMWSKTTKIPLSQFYKARIDPRTIGKPTKKTDYKGVCVIDYFSAKVFAELLEIPKILAGL